MHRWNPSDVGDCFRSCIVLCPSYRFGCPRAARDSTWTYDHGYVQPFVIPFTHATFTMLLDRCKFSRQVLELGEQGTIAGHSSSFAVQDKSSDPVDIKSSSPSSPRKFELYPHRLTMAIPASGFLGMIRLHLPLIVASSYDPVTGTTTGLILNTNEAEAELIKGRFRHHQAYTGHELLLRTILTELSLQYAWRCCQR